jgi:hypothetical protein
MKIKYLSISVSASGLKRSMSEFECTKSPTGFIVYKESNFGGKTTRVKKEQILKYDSMSTPNLYNMLHAYTWFFKGDEEKARILLIDELLVIAKRQMDVAEKLFKAIA